MLENRILVHFADICLHISSTTEQIEMIFKKKSFIDLITSIHTYISECWTYISECWTYISLYIHICLSTSWRIFYTYNCFIPNFLHLFLKNAIKPSSSHQNGINEGLKHSIQWYLSLDDIIVFPCTWIELIKLNNTNDYTRQCSSPGFWRVYKAMGWVSQIGRVIACGFELQRYAYLAGRLDRGLLKLS